MNNACTSRWCRRSRIIIKRQWRRFEKHPMRLFWWLTGIITAIFILCIIFARSSETAYTAFGSYFTALAFVGVIVTVLLQRAELQEQRKELRAQRIELEGQKRELEIQNRTAQLQRFENSFFHLLTNFKSTTNKIDTTSIHKSISKFSLSNKKVIENFLDAVYIKFETASKRFLLEYYEIIYFIYTHDAFVKNKNDIFKYISILNLLLTNSEYTLIFYDAIRDEKKIKIINELHLFSRYSLLNESHPPLKPEHVLFFSPEAFGEDYEEYIRRHNLQGKTLEDFLQ
ncbi:hypothetical protein [Desulfovibrio piger]|uniref:hypothetical protein n=1 Tax=Desulfovibrio piger TaxID=901 RepID=UPI002430B1AA|nr:hypothetical protein [Desulfovibrio piger]